MLPRAAKTEKVGERRRSELQKEKILELAAKRIATERGFEE